MKLKEMSLSVIIAAILLSAGGAYADARCSLWPLWYTNAYPDLQLHWGHKPEAEQVQHAIWHWNKYGVHEGRSPNPFFSPTFYAAKYPDLVRHFGVEKDGQQVIDDYAPIVRHYIDHGIDEGRQGARTFDPSYYLSTYPDVARVYGENNWRGAFAHYMRHGASEGRMPAGAADWDAADMACIKASLIWAGKATLAIGGAWGNPPLLIVAGFIVAEEGKEPFEKCMLASDGTAGTGGSTADRHGTHGSEPTSDRHGPRGGDGAVDHDFRGDPDAETPITPSERGGLGVIH